MAAQENQVDVLLVQAMADGDVEAVGRLYDRHAPRLIALGLRMLGNREEAEDLVHDVLLEAWRAAPDYDASRGTVRTWLAMRFRSRALDRLRSAGRSRSVSMEEGGVPEKPAPEGEDPALGPDRQRLCAALVGLPEGQRAVLELAYFEGLSSTEIAERLAVPVGTVKSRTAAALGKLRATMGARAGEAT
jgi:RNA polymerase sigma-70 factor (ECF subfamily)